MATPLRPLVLEGRSLSARPKTRRKSWHLIKAAYLKADTVSRRRAGRFTEPSWPKMTALLGRWPSELIAAKALQDGDIEFARREFNFLSVWRRMCHLVCHYSRADSGARNPAAGQR